MKRAMIILAPLGLLLAGCGINQSGLKDAATAEMMCDQPLKTRTIFSGYGRDDLIAKVEVTGCDRSAIFTKYGDGFWVQTTDTQLAQSD